MSGRSNIQPGAGKSSVGSPPPSSAGKSSVNAPPSTTGTHPSGRQSGGAVQAEAARKAAIANALRLIAQSPEFGALLRGAEGKPTQQNPPDRR